MWLKVDHHILDHPKWEILEHDPARWSRAVSVWVACGTVCSRLQTDGLILSSRVRRACPLDAADVQAALDDLVLAGFLVEQDGELWMHNFLKYNFSKDEQDAKKASKSARNKRNYEARRDSAEKEIKPGLSGAEKEIKSRLKKDSAPLRTAPSTKYQDPSTKDPPVVPRGDDTKSERKGRTMRKDPAADFLAKTVTIQLNAHLGKRFDGFSKCARKAARRWRGEGWTETEIVEALKIRIAKLNAVGNTENQIPETLYNGKLADYVAMVKNGSTAAAMGARPSSPQNIREGRAEPSSRDEHLLDRGRDF